jgi:hypothetical protein
VPDLPPPTIQTNRDRVSQFRTRNINSAASLDSNGSNKFVKNIGVKVMDSPSMDSSELALKQIQMRASMPSSSNIPVSDHVPAINPKNHDYTRALAKWCESVLDIHSKENPDRVFYSKRMPNLEVLMNEWANPLGYESKSHEDTDEIWRQYRKKCLNDITSLAECDLDLKDFVKIACLLVDIPVYANDEGSPTKSGNNRHMIESLHVFFSLFHEFKASGHFGKLSAPM